MSSASIRAEAAAGDVTDTEAAPSATETTGVQQNVPASAAAQSCETAADRQADELILRSPLRRTQIQTVRLDARDVRPSWPLAIASLEQLSGWAVLALRLGTLALIQQCVRELAQPEASADLVVRLRVLTEALAHMPLEA